jgi:phenylacetate-CoA ligase
MMEALRIAAWQGWLRLSGPVPGHLATLERLRAGLGAYQEERLSALLAHAAARVPFYRSRLAEAGAVVDSRVRLERFTDIPPLTRAELRTHFAALTAEDADLRRCRINASGGSTGEPVRVLEDAGAHAWNAAAKLLFDGWSGYRPGMRRAVLWTSQHEVPSLRLRPKLGRWLRGERWVDVLRLHEEDLRAAAAALAAFRPRQILAFADRLYEIARLIETGRVPPIPVDSLMVSSCPCTPHMRAVIERAFAAPLYDRYGSRELGAVAGERTPGGGLLVAPTHLVEVLRPDGSPAPPGEVGELVVTHLVNRVLPLIRYRIGDRAAWRTTDDPWPVLTRIEGRAGDVFRAMDGAAVDNALFLYALEERPWVARYRVVQDTPDHVLVEVVPASPPPPDDVEDVRRRIRAVLGDGCRVEVRMVEAIPLSPSGKLRTLVSQCPPRA